MIVFNLLELSCYVDKINYDFIVMLSTSVEILDPKTFLALNRV